MGYKVLMSFCVFKEVKFGFSTFAMIKPVPPREHGKIITFIMNNGFRIVRMKNGKISKDFAMELYKDIAGHNMMPLVPIHYTYTVQIQTTKQTFLIAESVHKYNTYNGPVCGKPEPRGSKKNFLVNYLFTTN